MKQLLPLLIVTSLYSQWFNEWNRNPFLTPNAEKIILTDGFYYKEFSDIKYTGPVIELLVGSTSSKKSIYVGEMVNGEKDGKWTRWNINGRKKSEDNYKNGRPDGESLYYWNDGSILSIGVWKEGRQIGEHRKYFENGELNKITHYDSNGLYHGKSISWWENGKPFIERTYIHGKETGKSYAWWESGRLRVESEKLNGKDIGTTTFYHNRDNNPISSKWHYENGEQVSEECWDEDGNECECTGWSCK
jgi:antitoxin component YwqK of YwqJK toxin-antitoxin module